MMKQKGRTAGLLSGICLLTLLVVSCRPEQHHKTFTLMAVSCNKPGNPCSMITPVNGQKMGQYMVFSEQFTNEATGQPAGIDDGYCMLVDTAPMRYVCTKTATLSDGTLSYGGVYIPGDSVSTFSVWNGTGNYVHASGEVKVYHTPDSVRLVFMLR
jgi:hypothetical protein